MRERPPGTQFFADTQPEALEVFLDLHRRKKPGEKLRMVFEMMEMGEQLARAGVRQMYPRADQREIFMRAAARRLGRDLMIKVYGFDPDAQGESGDSQP